MWSFCVTLIPTLVFLTGTEGTLLEPVKQCVPTASVRGPTHMCVCSTEGVFHCHPMKQCQKQVEKKRPIKDCQSDYVYRENTTFCTCRKDGYWTSENCEQKFQYLRPPRTATHQGLRTNIECDLHTLYLIDCNICQCGEKGVIDLNSCTKRYCTKGHKADTCKYGDILRLSHEICSCSDINYYIDRLCIDIVKKEVQRIHINDIVKLVDIGKSWRRLRELQSDICDTNVIYTVDCNKCICLEGSLACTTKVCQQASQKPVVRSQDLTEYEVLPEVESDKDSCEPGKKYRLKCNTCLCSSDGSLSCTTMVCLDNYVLDLKALKGALTS